ncbi:MAG: hypothetical protein RL078_1072, partial [Bacteroidota bacterium]
MKTLLFLSTFTLGTFLLGQQQLDSMKRTAPVKKWYESVQIRGYLQVRYNGLLQTNEDLTCEQCDRSWGGENDFFIRRMRVIIYGQVNPRVYFYI